MAKKKESDNPRVRAGLVEEDFEQQPSDETVAAGEAINFDNIENELNARQLGGVIQNPYASPEEQGMELTPKTFGPPQYGSPDPLTSASRLATLEDGHPLDPGLLPAGTPAAISDDYGLQVTDASPLETDEDVDATDSARELATQEGVNLRDVEGTGADGRVTKGDVEDYIEARENS
jgi:pyruvate/2-oxoglutarate dehydrogenase complex dihydrolipoamide acyltransferase (E2) component